MPSISTYTNKTTPIATDKLIGTDITDDGTHNFTLLSIRQVYYPEDYGAVGDGTTDDTAALRACATAAAGRVMALQPGKTYLYSGSITLSANTNLRGNNATLKRRAGTAQVSTTLTEIAAGSGPSTDVQVADPSKFTVGMSVTLDDNTPDTLNGDPVDFSLYSHRITNIVGDVLTLATTFEAGMAFAVGSYIRMSTGCVDAAAGCKIHNIRFDGNRTNQLIGAATWGWWVQHYAIKIGGANVEVAGCEIASEQAEGIVINGDAASLHDNYIHDCGGNGIHLTGSNGSRIYANEFYNNNLQYTAGETLLTKTSGHQDGNISFSNAISYTDISGNWIKDTQLWGIGSINTSDQDITIRGNTFLNNTLGPVQITQGGSNVIIADNQIFACGGLLVQGSDLTTPAWVSIINNYFDASTITINYVNHGLFVGNMVNCPLVANPVVLTNCSADFLNEHNVIVTS